MVDVSSYVFVIELVIKSKKLLGHGLIVKQVV